MSQEIVEVRMKNRKLRKFNPGAWLLLAALLLAAGWLSMPQTTATAQNGGSTYVKPPFVLRNYGGKCLEYGVPLTPAETVWTSVPVFMSNCNGTTRQQIYIQELTDRVGHLVILRAGAGVIGRKLNSPPVAKDASKALSGDGAAAPSAGDAQLSASALDQTPLEVQPYTDPPLSGQIFALDGDSIILDENRDFVVEVRNGRGANRTPLVLGRRNLDDSEFWTFTAANGSGWRPTSGFVRVPVDKTLDDGFEFAEAVFHSHAGTVIEVDPSASIDLTDQHPIRIPGRVTIRGDRHGARFGPELRVREGSNTEMLEIAGSEVRITGLRMSGPTRSAAEDSPGAVGIIYKSDRLLFHRSIVDHNDMSGWTVAAVKVLGEELSEQCQAGDDNQGSLPENVRVARNFLHHNRMYGEGYGVETKTGGNTLIEGNTFVSNRHAIAAGGQARTIYRAWHNLVLQDAPQQHNLGYDWYTHDFDMHGTGDGLLFPAGFGGTGGQYVEISRNTFLGTNRANFDLRGEPCHMVEFHHNVSLRETPNNAIECTLCGGGINKLKVSDTNQFNAPNPTNTLGVGDFDGDGVEDLFLATGAAWYYAPAANLEWRFLNAQTDQIGALMFGDFDADGRTDVFTKHGRNWDVSWGGASKWDKINESDEALSDFHLGDFDGDKRADVFFASGQEWSVSSGGVGAFTHFAFATQRVSDLLFGDFNADDKTDVFGVMGDDWKVVYAGAQDWAPLRAKMTAPEGLTVADFDGDGYADVATSSVSNFNRIWQVSWGGVSDWTTLRPAGHRLVSAAAIGRFDANPGADVLVWSDNNLHISSAGSGGFERQSAQDMR